MKDALKKLSTWSKVLGWVQFISGIITGIIGVFIFLIGAVPGVITAILGWKLIQASKVSDKITAEAEEDNSNIKDLANSYGTYFQIQGIYTIVMIVLTVLFAILYITIIINIIANFHNSSSFGGIIQSSLNYR